jgi:hypothetical protein
VSVLAEVVGHELGAGDTEEEESRSEQSRQPNQMLDVLEWPFIDGAPWT